MIFFKISTKLPIFCFRLTHFTEMIPQIFFEEWELFIGKKLSTNGHINLFSSFSIQWIQNIRLLYNKWFMKILELRSDFHGFKFLLFHLKLVLYLQHFFTVLNFVYFILRAQFQCLKMSHDKLKFYFTWPKLLFHQFDNQF